MKRGMKYGKFRADSFVGSDKMRAVCSVSLVTQESRLVSHESRKMARLRAYEACGESQKRLLQGRIIFDRPHESLLCAAVILRAILVLAVKGTSLDYKCTSCTCADMWCIREEDLLFYF